MNANKVNETLCSIITKATSALVYDDPKSQAQVLGQIAAEISETISGTAQRPPDGTAPTVARKVGETAAESAASGPTGYDKFLTVAEGVKMSRFAGDGCVRLIAKRPARDGSPSSVFEIAVDKVRKIATASRDGKELFTVSSSGVNASLVEKMALSSLKSLLKANRKANVRSHRNSKRKQQLKKDLPF